MSVFKDQLAQRAAARGVESTTAKVDDASQEALYLYALPTEVRKDVVEDNAQATEEFDKQIAELESQIKSIRRDKAKSLEEAALAELDALLGYGAVPDYSSTTGAVFSMFVAAQMRQDLYNKSVVLGGNLALEPGDEDPNFVAWNASSLSAKYSTKKRVLSHSDKAELDSLEEYFAGFEGVSTDGVKLAGRRLAQLKREKNVAI